MTLSKTRPRGLKPAQKKKRLKGTALSRAPSKQRVRVIQQPH
jgi:hypothetical protein